MKSAFYKILLVAVFISLNFPTSLKAQEGISDYVPPPLFGSSVPQAQPIVPKPEKPIELRRNPNEAQPLKPIVKRPRPQQTAVSTIPVPKKKPIESKKVKEAEVKKTEPVKVTQKEKPTSEGVVKGPKTMPAVKKKAVDIELLEEEYSSNQPEETPELMARFQIEQQKKQQEQESKQKEKQALEENRPEKSLFEDRLVLVFDEKEANLSDQKQEVLFDHVVPVLSKNSQTLNVTAYATPQNGILHADKRMSLSRALAIREFLIEQGLKASQINIRAKGGETSIQPYDRVELELVSQ
ncbi:MAG: OmpA family protein [Pseudomonadota bacterium]